MKVDISRHAEASTSESIALSTNTTVPQSRAIATGHSIYRWFAIFTVGLSTTGALIALWQVSQAQVGLLELSLLLSFYFATAFGIEGGFHRFFSHNAYSAGPKVTYMIGALGSMAAEGPVLFWAATHRQHHAFTDREGDPHSPHLHDGRWQSRVRSFIHAHMGWLFNKQPSSWIKFAPDLLRRREIMTINQHYLMWVLLGLLLPSAIAGIISASWAGAFNGLIWGGLLRIFLLHHMTWTVNSLAHCYGRRPYSTSDNSANIAWLSIATVGGSLHNNHHAIPASARNDHQSIWQLDLSGLAIEALGKLKFVSNIKRVSDIKSKFNSTPTQS